MATRIPRAQVWHKVAPLPQPDHKRLYSRRRWHALRRQWLAEHPLCAECERRGEIRMATDVDHVTPHKGDAKLFWSTANMQSLCARCHGRKSAREQREARGA